MLGPQNVHFYGIMDLHLGLNELEKKNRNLSAQIQPHHWVLIPFKVYTVPTYSDSTYDFRLYHGVKVVRVQ